MVITLNKVNKTISFHRDNCAIVEKLGVDLKEYPNGYSTSSNQIWFSDENFSISKLQIFFKGLDYGKVFCQKCFK